MSFGKTVHNRSTLVGAGAPTGWSFGTPGPELGLAAPQDDSDPFVRSLGGAVATTAYDNQTFPTFTMAQTHSRSYVLVKQELIYSVAKRNQWATSERCVPLRNVGEIKFTLDQTRIDPTVFDASAPRLPPRLMTARRTSHTYTSREMQLGFEMEEDTYNTEDGKRLYAGKLKALASAWSETMAHHVVQRLVGLPTVFGAMRTTGAISSDYDLWMQAAKFFGCVHKYPDFEALMTAMMEVFQHRQIEPDFFIGQPGMAANMALQASTLNNTDTAKLAAFVSNRGLKEGSISNPEQFGKISCYTFRKTMPFFAYAGAPQSISEPNLQPLVRATTFGEFFPLRPLAPGAEASSYKRSIAIVDHGRQCYMLVELDKCLEVGGYFDPATGELTELGKYIMFGDTEKNEDYYTFENHFNVMEYSDGLRKQWGLPPSGGGAASTRRPRSPSLGGGGGPTLTPAPGPPSGLPSPPVGGGGGGGGLPPPPGPPPKRASLVIPDITNRSLSNAIKRGVPRNLTTPITAIKYGGKQFAEAVIDTDPAFRDPANWEITGGDASSQGVQDIVDYMNYLHNFYETTKKDWGKEHVSFSEWEAKVKGASSGASSAPPPSGRESLLSSITDPSSRAGLKRTGINLANLAAGVPSPTPYMQQPVTSHLIREMLTNGVDVPLQPAIMRTMTLNMGSGIMGKGGTDLGIAAFGNMLFGVQKSLQSSHLLARMKIWFGVHIFNEDMALVAPNIRFAGRVHGGEAKIVDYAEYQPENSDGTVRLFALDDDLEGPKSLTGNFESMPGFSDMEKDSGLASTPGKKKIDKFYDDVTKLIPAWEITRANLVGAEPGTGLDGITPEFDKRSFHTRTEGYCGTFGMGNHWVRPNGEWRHIASTSHMRGLAGPTVAGNQLAGLAGYVKDPTKIPIPRFA